MNTDYEEECNVLQNDSGTTWWGPFDFNLLFYFDRWKVNLNLNKHRTLFLAYLMLPNLHAFNTEHWRGFESLDQITIFMLCMRRTTSDAYPNTIQKNHHDGFEGLGWLRQLIILCVLFQKGKHSLHCMLVSWNSILGDISSRTLLRLQSIIILVSHIHSLRALERYFRVLASLFHSQSKRSNLDFLHSSGRLDQMLIFSLL